MSVAPTPVFFPSTSIFANTRFRFYRGNGHAAGFDLSKLAGKARRGSVPAGRKGAPPPKIKTSSEKKKAPKKVSLGQHAVFYPLKLIGVGLVTLLHALVEADRVAHSMFATVIW